jgi:hypothetical protein
MPSSVPLASTFPRGLPWRRALLTGVLLTLPLPANALGIAVWDAATHDEIARIEPGRRLTLEPGRQVVLRVYLSADESASGEREYLSGEWWHEAGDTIELDQIQIHKGSARLVTRAAGNGELGFTSDELDEDLVLWIRVTGGPPAAPPPLPGPAPAPTPDVPIELPAPGDKPKPGSGFDTSTPAGRAVAALYRGILLREPDESARSWSDAVTRGGWRALVEVAGDIAKSRESRVDLYERDEVTPQKRVEALYRHLLGVGPEQLDGATWNRAVSQVESGDITGLVDALIENPGFRRRFGY